MKTKLTVTIDEDLLPRAKSAARRRGASLSSIIEKSLRELADEELDFVGKWRGEFRAPSSEDPRIRHLMEKYVADSD
jgi:hypothetical protein